MVRVVIGAVLFLTPLVFWRGALEAFEVGKVAVVQLAALVLLAVAAIALVRRRGAIRSLDPVSRAMILAAAAALLSTLTSISPRTSLRGHYQHGGGLLTVLALLAVYFAARSIFRTSTTARGWFLWIAAALPPIIGYALVQVGGYDPWVWENTSPFAQWTRPFSTLGHPNQLAGYLVMALPLVLWLAKEYDALHWPKLAMALAVTGILGAAVVVACLSRAAWLAGALAALLLIVLGRGGLRVEWRRRRFLVLTAALVIAGGLFLAKGGISLVGERLLHLTERSSRVAVWRAAWSAFLSRPWTGTGLDTFDLAFGPHRSEDYWRVEWGVIPTRAHNDLLHTLATQGAAGGAAFLLLAAMLIWAVCRALRRDAGGQDRLLIVVVAASLSAWYVQNLFGFPGAATASLFAVLAALLSRLAWPDPDKETGLLLSPCHLVTLSPCLLLAAWFLVARPWLAGCACHQGDLLRDADPQQALACHERAVRLDPDSDVLQVKLANGLVAAARTCSAREEQRRLLRAAGRAVDRACALTPVSAENHANRGRILEGLAQAGLTTPEVVLQAFEKALALDPLNSIFLADVARVALRCGRLEQAKEYLRRGLLIDPDSGLLLTELGAVALAEKRFADAEDALNRADAGAWHDREQGMTRMRGLLCWTLLERGRPDEARELADTVLQDEGDSVPIHVLRGLALERLGWTHLAQREYEWVLRAQPNNAIARTGLARLVARR